MKFNTFNLASTTLVDLVTTLAQGLQGLPNDWDRLIIRSLPLLYVDRFPKYDKTVT